MYLQVSVTSVYTFLYVIFCIQPGESLVGYDCDKGAFNYTTISLSDLPICIRGKPDYSVETKYGVLAQVTKHRETKAYVCEVIIHRIIHICDTFSSSESATGDFLAYPKDIPPEECKRMHEEGSYEYKYGDKLYGLKKNRRERIAVTFAGHTKMRGGCSGVSYYSDVMGVYENVVVTGYVEIMLTDLKGMIDFSHGTITFTNGLRCNYVDSTCKDKELSTVVWKMSIENNCWKMGIYRLFEGFVSELSTKNFQGDPLRHIIINSTDIKLSSKIKHNTEICNHPAWVTMSDDIVFIPLSPNDKLQLRDDIPSVDVSILDNTLLKLHGMDVHIGEQMMEMYNMLIYNDCINERRLIELQLNLGATDPIQFAISYNQGPGATAVVSGEVIHVAKCTPITVELINSDKCFKDIIVKVGNSTKYLNARTRIISDISTPIPCSPLVNVMFKEENTWYNTYPSVHEVKSPRKIESSLHTGWKYATYEKELSSNIYSKEILRESSMAMMYRYDYDGISNTLSHDILAKGGYDGQIQLGRLIDEVQIEVWYVRYTDKIWGWAKFVGNITTGTIGLYVLAKLIFFIFHTIANGVALYELFGFSWALLLSFFNAFTRLTVQYTKKKRDKLTTPDEENTSPFIDPQVVTTSGNIRQQPANSVPMSSNSKSSAPENALYPPQFF